MSWAIGYDEERKRDVGYGVPAKCDHPGCAADIDRGLGYICGEEPGGGEHGCGLFICSTHTHSNNDCCQLCSHCADRRRKKLTPSADTPEWIEHKLADESWQQWRDENAAEVLAMRAALLAHINSIDAIINGGK
jgi:hypothetical protein